MSRNTDSRTRALSTVNLLKVGLVGGDGALLLRCIINQGGQFGYHLGKRPPRSPGKVGLFDAMQHAFQPMIVLFSDFGVGGPYIGQMKAVLRREAPRETALIDLFGDAPAFDPRASAYLLAAFVEDFPAHTVFLCVVDPGVGTERRGAVVRVDGRWFVGPDNGLFNVVLARGVERQWWDLTYRPARLSNTFHGRDVFAPVAAMLARGEAVPGVARPVAERLRAGWSEDYARVIYIDHYGNAMTGLRAASLPLDAVLGVRSRHLSRARTFADVPQGEAFWYENSAGLAELAVNQGRAQKALAIDLGDEIEVL